MSSKETTLVIDPVAMNIRNRICEESISRGTSEFGSGLLIQGQHHGRLVVRGGPLVIYDGAYLTGEIEVYGDVFVFGQVGGTDSEAVNTVLTVHGTLHLTGRALAYGRLKFVRIATYDGAQMNAALETIKEAVAVESATAAAA